MNYICHVTDKIGRVHRVEVAGNCRDSAMRDALAKVPGADRVSCKAPKYDRQIPNVRNDGYRVSSLAKPPKPPVGFLGRLFS